MLRGTGKPFGWKLADGGDDPSTFLVTSAASKQGMRQPERGRGGPGQA